MTAPALTRTAPPRPARPRRALLRLHRPALIAWGVFVAVISAVLLWAYGPLGNSAHAAWQQQCTEDVCDWNDAIEGYHLAYTLSEVAIGFLPILVAVWAGGLLIGRELENGTASLAWTQSISPARWLATKLAVPAALLTAGTTLLVLLHRLLFDAHQVPDGWGWNDHNTFYANGTVAIAFPLLGLTVGALTGLVQPGPGRRPRRRGTDGRVVPHLLGKPPTRAVEDQRRRPEGGLRGTRERHLRRRRRRHLHRRPHPRPVRRRRKGLPGRP
jgi:hypothetical protein